MRVGAPSVPRWASWHRGLALRNPLGQRELWELLQSERVPMVSLGLRGSPWSPFSKDFPEPWGAPGLPLAQERLCGCLFQSKRGSMVYPGSRGALEFPLAFMGPLDPRGVSMGSFGVRVSPWSPLNLGEPQSFSWPTTISTDTSQSWSIFMVAPLNSRGSPWLCDQIHEDFHGCPSHSKRVSMVAPLNPNRSPGSPMAPELCSARSRWLQSPVLQARSRGCRGAPGSCGVGWRAVTWPDDGFQQGDPSSQDLQPGLLPQEGLEATGLGERERAEQSRARWPCSGHGTGTRGGDMGWGHSMAGVAQHGRGAAPAG